MCCYTDICDSMCHAHVANKLEFDSLFGLVALLVHLEIMPFLNQSFCCSYIYTEYVQALDHHYHNQPCITKRGLIG